MDRWFDPSYYNNVFRFWPLPPDVAALTERDAIDVASNGHYLVRWPAIQVAAAHGRFDDGGRGVTVIPDPGAPPAPRRLTFSRPRSAEERRLQHLWDLEQNRWRSEREHSARLVPHQNRLVWLVAFVGVPVPYSPHEQVRMQVVDVEMRRVLTGFSTAVATFEPHLTS